MNYTCPNCGNMNVNVQNAAVIVAEQTTTSTVPVQGIADGKPVQYSITRSSQTEVARNLSSDEPRKGINWFSVFCVLMLMPPIFLLFFASCATLEAANGNSINLQSFTLLLSCVVGLIVVSIAMSVVSKARTKRFNQKYNNWLNLLNRRFYCRYCGYIIQF